MSFAVTTEIKQSPVFLPHLARHRAFRGSFQPRIYLAADAIRKIVIASNQSFADQTKLGRKVASENGKTQKRMSVWRLQIISPIRTSGPSDDRRLRSRRRVFLSHTLFPFKYANFYLNIFRIWSWTAVLSQIRHQIRKNRLPMEVRARSTLANVPFVRYLPRTLQRNSLFKVCGSQFFL